MFINRQKIGVIGAGDIGLNLAEILALNGYNVVLHNRFHSENGAPSPVWLAKQGFVMDLNDSLQIPACGKVKLTSSLDELNNLNLIVITAGAKRSSPTETREELAIKNAKIIDGYTQLAVQNSNAIILIISNPVDFLTQYFINQVVQKTDFGHEETAKRVFGVSYIDSMRLRNIVKEVLSQRILNIENSFVEGIAIGEHGPTMVPLMSHVKIDGTSISNIATEEEMNAIFSQTVLRGNDIIKLTGMSSVKGPAHAAYYMISQILNQFKATLTCSVWDGVRCIGRNVVFYKSTFDHIEDTVLTEHEQTLLKISETTLDSQYVNLAAKINKLAA